MAWLSTWVKRYLRRAPRRRVRPSSIGRPHSAATNRSPVIDWTSSSPSPPPPRDPHRRRVRRLVARLSSASLRPPSARRAPRPARSPRAPRTPPTVTPGRDARRTRRKAPFSLSARVVCARRPARHPAGAARTIAPRQWCRFPHRPRVRRVVPPRLTKEINYRLKLKKKQEIILVKKFTQQ